MVPWCVLKIHRFLGCALLSSLPVPFDGGHPGRSRDSTALKSVQPRPLSSKGIHRHEITADCNTHRRILLVTGTAHALDTRLYALIALDLPLRDLPSA
jgi:hypothetical protein